MRFEPGLDPATDDDDATKNRRKSPLLTKATAGGVSLSVGLLYVLMQQQSGMSTSIAELTRQRTADQAMIGELSTTVRQMQVTLVTAIASNERRLADGERELTAMRGVVREHDTRLLALERAGKMAFGGRIALIARALRGIPRENAALWRADGSPTVAAATAAFGSGVSARELTLAWAIAQSPTSPDDGTLSLTADTH